MFMMYFVHNFLTNVLDTTALLRPKPVVRKLWIKYIINIVVHFVGFIYIYILWIWLMHRRWDILKYYTCGCIPNKGCKIYVQLTTKGLRYPVHCYRKKSSRFCQVCSHPNNILLMKYILQKGKGVKLGTYPSFMGYKNYWPCKQRKDGNFKDDDIPTIFDMNNSKHIQRNNSYKRSEKQNLKQNTN